MSNKAGEKDYERVTNIAGVKTTYCRNRLVLMLEFGAKL